jgi:tetratricopeptide (TPR) repeat protein
MKQKLPPPSIETIALFPRNIRIITEYSFPEKQSTTIKVILTSAVSLFLIAMIFMQGIAFWKNIQQKEALLQQREQLHNQVKYWQDISQKYQGYRDVYYRIAAIEYKLGDVSASQAYVKKALELDPNFPEGRVLGAHIGLNNSH